MGREQRAIDAGRADRSTRPFGSPPFFPEQAAAEKGAAGSQTRRRSSQLRFDRFLSPHSLHILQLDVGGWWLCLGYYVTDVRPCATDDPVAFHRLNPDLPLPTPSARP